MEIKISSRLRLERLESLLTVLIQDTEGSDDDLLPVAGAGLKLLISPNGSLLRKNLLLTLIKDERINTSDIKGLIQLLKRTFKPKEMAGKAINKLNPLKI